MKSFKFIPEAGAVEDPRWDRVSTNSGGVEVTELATHLLRRLPQRSLVKAFLGLAHLHTEGDSGALAWLALETDATAQTLGQLLRSAQADSDARRLEHAQFGLAEGGVEPEVSGL